MALVILAGTFLLKDVHTSEVFLPSSLPHAWFRERKIFKMQIPLTLLSVVSSLIVTTSSQSDAASVAAAQLPECAVGILHCPNLGGFSRCLT